MTLELLLQEESAIGYKISTALSSIEKWFEKKIERVEDLFESTKEKVSSAIEKFKDNLRKKGANVKVPVDIEFEKYNHSTIKALHGRMSLHEIFTELASIFKEMIVLFQKDCMSVIHICKYGWSEVKRLKNRRNDRVELEKSYVKLSDSQKKAKIRYNEVTTGTECIEKNLSKIRVLKSTLRQALIEKIDDDEKEVNKDYNHYRYTTDDDKYDRISTRGEYVSELERLKDKKKEINHKKGIN